MFLSVYFTYLLGTEQIFFSYGEYASVRSIMNVKWSNRKYFYVTHVFYIMIGGEIYITIGGEIQ